MTKTGLSVLTASLLIVASVVLALSRRHALGEEINGPPALGSWRVTLTATGDLNAREGSLLTTLPPDARHQHILDETWHSKELLARLVKTKDKSDGRRELIWKPSSLTGSTPYRAVVSFRCLVGLRKPTTAMQHLTHQLDAEPRADLHLQPSPRIESESEEVRREVAQVIGEAQLPPMEMTRAFFDHVRGFDTEPTLGKPCSARDCLRDHGGDSGGKSRLLVALCRNRGIPARLLGGLLLVGDQEQGLHYWVEAWVNGHWLPMCPVFKHFGQHKFPRNYLVLTVGDDDVVRCRGGLVSYGFVVQDVHNVSVPEEQSASWLTAFWRKLSLHDLRPGEQRLVKFLLLLPVGALIVSVFRTVIGLPTFGTFGPALLGMVFVDLKSLTWGLPIFVLTVLVGWGMRHLLERFHLLQVPRTAALLTMVVAFLIVAIVAASHAGIVASQYLSLFPLVILTHLVERFWTVETEDSASASFRTLLGTMFVAVSVSVVLSLELVSSWMFRYPETLGGVLAAQFLLGRYTGYRVSELYRFGALLHDVPFESALPPRPLTDTPSPTETKAVLDTPRSTP